MEQKHTIDYRAIKKFIERVLIVHHIEERIAQYVSEGLVQTSLRGVDSHGIRLFPHYLDAVKAGRIKGNPTFSFDKTSASTGILDADHTFGHAAGMEAVQRAIEIAKEAGSANISVKNSSHFGAAAYFALEIARHDMIGMACTHANSFMLTYNGAKPFFGTNPICFAVPCEGEEPFCLDMATTLWTINKVFQQGRRGQDIPSGVGVDKNADETLDPNKVVSLLPIGLYKGFGLAFMVEILCGLLSGMPVGKEITDMYETPINQKRFLGQFFSAIRIDCFMDPKIFKKKMKLLMDTVREQPRKNPHVPVMVPNDPEKHAYAERLKQGIPLDHKDWETLVTIGKEYSVELKGD